MPKLRKVSNAEVTSEHYFFFWLLGVLPPVRDVRLLAGVRVGDCDTSLTGSANRTPPFPTPDLRLVWPLERDDAAPLPPAVSSFGGDKLLFCSCTNGYNS